MKGAIARRWSRLYPRDEGESWGCERAIGDDSEDDYGYQSVTFLEDDLVILSYHARDGLHVVHIRTDWFYRR